MVYRIARLGSSAPIALAAEELIRYLSKMDSAHTYELVEIAAYEAGAEHTLWVGIDPEIPIPEVTDSALDDSIAITFDGQKGTISGANDRSVLIAAYRFLRELGCGFLRPGAEGEIIPTISLADARISVFEAASYRHRGTCIEGADSYEHVRDFIEWMPKVGMNTFFNQMLNPHHFYVRWYSHKLNEENYEDVNPDFDRETAAVYLKESVKEIKKRGMLCHEAGHGWTCEPFGVEGLGWGKETRELDEATKRNFAMINGERGLYKGVAVNTNLCYSSEYVIDTMVNAIYEYAAARPELDYIHLWLADGTNNHCECEECKKKTPADHYVHLLNRVDEKLTAAGISAKIVFLIYVDLLWAPQVETLKNPDRFALMFAPITRTYSSSIIEDMDFNGELPPYKRNKNIMPSSVAENIAHLRKWQKIFKGDSFIYDYYFIWDHCKDLGHAAISRVLFKDLQNLHKLGINGSVDCQILRIFFPHGLGMHAMATALWDETAEYEQVASAYFQAAFGAQGAKVRAYMEKLSEITHPPFLRGEDLRFEDAAFMEQLQSGLKMVEEFRPIAKSVPADAPRAVQVSYEYLQEHFAYAKAYLEWELALASGKRQETEQALEVLKDVARKMEPRIHQGFEYYLLEKTLGMVMKKMDSYLK